MFSNKSTHIWSVHFSHMNHRAFGRAHTFTTVSLPASSRCINPNP